MVVGMRKKICSKIYYSLVVSCSIAFPINYIPTVAIASPNISDTFELSPEQLMDAEIISVSKKTETVSDAPAAIYVITNEDIIRSGVTTIPDALRMAPGVEVAQSDANSWAISIRGLNSVLANKLLVLIDGRTIYNPIFGGVLWEAQDLMLEDIERIEVIRGPGGTLWGANAVNGVINIITKKAADTQGRMATALIGNEELGTFGVRQGGRFGDENFYRVYAKYYDRDSSVTPNNTDAFDQSGGYRSGFRTDWGTKFTLQGDVYHTDTNQQRIEYSLISPYAELQRQRIIYEGANILGRWVDERNDGSRLTIQSYLDWTRRNEPVNFIDNRMIYDLELQYNLSPLGRHEIIVGSGFRMSFNNEQGTKNVSFSPKSYMDSLYSAFLQDKITLVPETLFFTIGTKLEHNDYSGGEIQPNARLQWHLNDRQTIWSSVSRAVRTPTPIEENLTSTIASGAGVRFAFVPNDNFKSEELTAYEIGYRQQITPTLSTDVAAFYNQYDHLSTFKQLPFYPVINGVDPPHFFVPIQFQNNMKGETHGFEVLTSWNINPDLKVTANYSLLRLSMTAVDPTQESAEDNYPQQMANIHAAWNINEEWALDTTLYYMDKLSGTNVDAHTRVDANLAWKIRDGLNFNLIGQNILGAASHREYGSSTDINASEVQRSVFGKLTWKF